MKRFVLILVAVIIACLSIPMQIFAENTEDKDSSVYEVNNYPFVDTVNGDGDSKIPYIVTDKGEFTGKVFKINITEYTQLAFDVCPINSMYDIINVECIIFIFTANSEDNTKYDLIDSYYDVAWHAPIITFESPGEYYVYCCNYSDNTSSCVVSIEDATNEIIMPDFRDAEVRLPNEDELWSWDATSKTLTLKNGFTLTAFEETAVYLPDGATVVVEGTVAILCWTDALYSEGDMLIQLQPGADLYIKTFSEHAMYTNNGSITITGTADDIGNKPSIEILSSHYAIYVGEEGDVTISDCDIDLCAYEAAIYNNNGKIQISNVNMNIYNSLEGIINIYDVDFITDSTEYFILFNNSVINIAAYGNAIKSLYGNVDFIDCITDITSKTGRGLISTQNSSLTVRNGKFSIVAASEAIIVNDGSATFDKVPFYLKTESDEKLLYVSSEIICSDNIRIASSGDLSYVGIWDNSYHKGGNIILRDENDTEISAKVLMSVQQGDKEKNTVTGINNTVYERDALVSFITNVGELQYKYYNIGDTRWRAVSWEVVDTQLGGSLEDVQQSWGEFYVNELSGGSYILRVRFEKQTYDGNNWLYAIEPKDEEINFIDVAFQVKEPPKVPEVGDCCTYFLPIVVVIGCAITILNKKVLKD